MNKNRKHKATITTSTYALIIGQLLLLSFSFIHTHHIAFTNIKNIQKETKHHSHHHSLYECNICQQALNLLCFYTEVGKTEIGFEKEKLSDTYLQEVKLQENLNPRDYRAPPTVA